MIIFTHTLDVQNPAPLAMPETTEIVQCLPYQPANCFSSKSEEIGRLATIVITKVRCACEAFGSRYSKDQKASDIMETRLNNLPLEKDKSVF